MCINCPDMITDCWKPGCYNPNGGNYGKSRKFYIGDEYCRHLQEQYGHTHAEWEDRGLAENDGEEPLYYSRKTVLDNAITAVIAQGGWTVLHREDKYPHAYAIFQQTGEFNHAAHIALTAVTMGLWIPIYVFQYFGRRQKQTLIATVDSSGNLNWTS